MIAPENAPEKRTQDAISRFVELVRQGTAAWLEAGRIVAAELDRNPLFAEQVCQAHPEISEDTVFAFQAIGQKKLHPALLVNNKPGPRMLRMFNYELQEKHITEPVDVLINNNGSWEPLKVSIYNLTRKQADQVFNGDGIRSLAAQRAWIETKKTVESVPIVETPWRIENHQLFVVKPCKFTRKEISQILSQMI